MKETDPTFECIPKVWTELVNSTWRILKEGVDCKAKCFDGTKSAREVVEDAFKPPGRVHCEFLEAVCWDENQEAYGTIHTQVIPKPRPPATVPGLPNVIVITVDSMNWGMARRSIPAFLEYFYTEFQGIEFPFVNKLAENSKPNGFPLWFGKSTEYGRRVDWAEIKPDWDFDTSCETKLDDQSHIFKDFSRAGYATVLMEDGVFSLLDSFPTCVGFDNEFVDHNFRVFNHIQERRGSRSTQNRLDGSLCKEYHHAMFDYLEQSLNVYTDRPIFSWMWPAKISHNQVDGIKRMDQFLINFFKRNKKTLENSFVFFAADHGYRFGEHLTTELGSFERDNPYLSISIPKNLRGSEFGILETLKTNSKQLQTHFDTRATLLDILKVTSLLEFAYTANFTTYRIAVKTKSPQYAYFETLLKYDPSTDKTEFEKVLRLDEYGGTVECTDSIRHEPLCHCRE
uniref:Sulfatase domain-containing protein n=1 Tax=Caenorhabditis tropicalis TaxID=1561998 RepID=A0A1I7UZ52_9PELO